MRLSRSLLLPALAGAASAATQTPASAYLFEQAELLNSFKPATLSPVEARFVMAQRLGLSQYHDITDASDSTLDYINTFGGHPQQLLSAKSTEEPSQLVVIVEGVTTDIKADLMASYEGPKGPAFYISNPPATRANAQLVKDLTPMSNEFHNCGLSEAVNPHGNMCWEGKTKIMHVKNPREADMDELKQMLFKINELASTGSLETLLVLIPESASNSNSKPYGNYESAKAVRKTQFARRQEEELLTESFPESTTEDVRVSSQGASSFAAPLVPVPVCHASLAACEVATANCSGHGSCFRKYGNSDGSTCYACGCVPTVMKVGDSTNTTYWGGSTCAKRDVSGPFWLIAIFTVVLIGLVSWSIGLLFSVGNEKLPGVIGAGVSGPKAR